VSWAAKPVILAEPPLIACETHRLKKLVLVAISILGFLQYQIWFGQSGYFAQNRLGQEVQKHRDRVALLNHRNRLLTGQVIELKRDPSALESRARRDLGMVRKGEVYYLISPARP
jgi:cell division protein FtsB